MAVEVRSEHPRGRTALGRIRARARSYLAALGRTEADLSILLVTDRAIRRLNRRWRDVDRATDVLSFPLSVSPGHGPHLGDVVISLDTAARRARAEGRLLGTELDRYLAHGLLHLLGYDHDRPAAARKMAEREEALVHGEGLVGRALRQGRSVRGGGRGSRRGMTRSGRGEESWTHSPTSTSTPRRSGSTGPGTRARTSPDASSR